MIKSLVGKAVAATVGLLLPVPNRERIKKPLKLQITNFEGNRYSGK